MNHDLKPILVRLVPRTWTPEQALAAVALLQQATAVIWSVHGAAMSRVVLGDTPDDEPAKKPSEAPRTPEPRRKAP